MCIRDRAEHISFENLVKHLVELKFSDLPRLLKDLAGFQQAQKEKTKEETAEAGEDSLLDLLDPALFLSLIHI